MIVRFSSLAEYIIETEKRQPPTGIVRTTIEHRPFMSGLIIAVSIVAGHIDAAGMLVECVEFIGERSSHYDTFSQEIMRRAQGALATIETRLKSFGLIVANGRYDLASAKEGAR